MCWTEEWQRKWAWVILQSKISVLRYILLRIFICNLWFWKLIAEQHLAEPPLWHAEFTKEELVQKLSSTTKSADHLNGLLQETEATNAILMEQIKVRSNTATQKILSATGQFSWPLPTLQMRHIHHILIFYDITFLKLRNSNCFDIYKD